MRKELYKKLTEIAGVSIIDGIYKLLVYRDLWMSLSKSHLKRKTKQARNTHKKSIARLQQKDRCTVAFFLQNSAIWKYDTLYRLLEQSEHYKPIIVIVPYNVHLIYDRKECLNVMKETVNFARQSGYDYISAYDFEHEKWLDVKKIVKPDIVFFTKPYKDTLPQYHIYNFKEQLTLYVPYGINCMNLFKNNYGLSFHNLLWKLLVETEFQKQYAEQYQLCKGDNVEVVGAITIEKLMSQDYHPVDVWKPQSTPKKRIIWAPHHTVDYLFNFSNFLEYADFMLELADRYKEQVQFAFKPHPVLKFKLLNIWGKEKTESYYQKWADLENGQIAEGEYLDLFATSDAMIHDSGSFTVEYLYTKKPVLFQVKHDEVEKQWNSFGQKCFACHYHSRSQAEVVEFIEQVVLDGNDSLKEQREQLYTNYLYPKDGIMPSQKIFNLLNDTLRK